MNTITLLLAVIGFITLAVAVFRLILIKLPALIERTKGALKRPRKGSRWIAVDRMLPGKLVDAPPYTLG